MHISVRVEHLYMQFKGETVLRDVTVDFEEGKIHGIIGNNGSGKTVMFKCICGFLRPAAGRVLVDFAQVGKDFDFPPNTGFIIESPGFLPYYSGLKNLQILASLNKKVTTAHIADVIRQVGLDPASKKAVSKYSLGMRQRLGIAQAIMEEPELLILDEPFNGLDRNGVSEMRELMKLQREKGRTILLSSHNAADIEELCDTVCEMDAGVLTRIK